MLKEVFLALWFFLPAGIANVMPIFVAKIRQLERFGAPMDFGRTFRGKRIFGAHKTWRGLVAGVVFGTLTLGLQQLAVAHSGWLADWTSQVDYPNLPTLVLGPLFAIGALGGDAIESFFKRQRGIPPGNGWFPFDQTDYIIGGALATMPFVTLSLVQYSVLIVLWLVVHVISTVIGYFLGLKDKPI
ncbi:MAG TPA: CDP-archaeol synthase [Candidatus Saccharimonadales bacterium]|nr:CDP-archaeol synthase [Candidatus Saccharimonadales bacterium]